LESYCPTSHILHVLHIFNSIQFFSLCRLAFARRHSHYIHSTSHFFHSTSKNSALNALHATSIFINSKNFTFFISNLLQGHTPLVLHVTSYSTSYILIDSMLFMQLHIQSPASSYTFTHFIFNLFYPTYISPNQTFPIISYNSMYFNSSLCADSHSLVGMLFPLHIQLH